MTMMPLGGIVGSAAGTPMSQTAGAEAERAQKDGSAQARAADANAKAELAAGIGQTSEDQQSSERDADGRRPWESPAGKGKKKDAEQVSDATSLRQSKDATGQCGNQLDLTG